MRILCLNVGTFEIVDAVGASCSSVSVATQLLIRLSLIERFGVPNLRRDHYRIRDDAWSSMLAQDIASAKELLQLAHKGLVAHKGAARAHSARLRAMHEFYAFLSGSLEPLLEAWESRNANTRRSP